MLPRTEAALLAIVHAHRRQLDATQAAVEGLSVKVDALSSRLAEVVSERDALALRCAMLELSDGAQS